MNKFYFLLSAMVVCSNANSIEFEDRGLTMKPEDFQQQDRFFLQPIAKALCLFAGILILGSCVSSAIVQEVWIRKGLFFFSNGQNEKTRNATAKGNYLSQTDGRGKTNERDAMAPVPVSTSAQEKERKCNKTFIVTGRTQYGQLVQKKIVVTKRFDDWTTEELDGKPATNYFELGQIDSEERKYQGGNYTPIKFRTKKQDCGGYVMDQLWGTGQYITGAHNFFETFIATRQKDKDGKTTAVIAGFAHKISGNFMWGNLQINDIVVYPGIGSGVGHIAIVRGFEKGGKWEGLKKGGFSGEYSSIIIETKDGGEKVYRHDLIKAIESYEIKSTRPDDPLIKNYGTPEIWRVDPTKISVVPLTSGECDEPSKSYDLTGTWTCIQRCPAGGVGKDASITQNGNTLTLTNEGGGTSSGIFIPPAKVQATNWGNLTASIENDGNKLTWSNGTVWVKKK